NLYIDITKDRLYCDAADSPRRRATQSAMHLVYSSLVRLLAPILVYTAEEAWSHFGAAESVHLEMFPEFETELLDPEAEADGAALLQARSVVAQALEQLRQDKVIGNNLEAHVVLTAPPDHRLHRLPLSEVEEFLILSQLDLVPQEGELTASATRTDWLRCERCWRHRAAVGTIAAHPSLCDRCADVMTNI
ncbi:MAG: class I tRNA ligase family protein, partial [Verrucomicrobia bacterium]|nr:class I tRNA ligase family protein [Verrucomicrobiota bacterium]